jgi:hypothetical protein
LMKMYSTWTLIHQSLEALIGNDEAVQGSRTRSSKMWTVAQCVPVASVAYPVHIGHEKCAHSEPISTNKKC